MNCQKFQSMASELARGQMMEVELRDEALVHSSNCPNCATQMRNEETLTRGLKSLATEMSSLEAPPALEMNLLNAFRQQQVVVPIQPRRDYRRYWLAAVAALILIVFSVVAFRIQRDRGQLSPPQQAFVKPEKQETQPKVVKQEAPPKQEQTLAGMPQRKQRKHATINPESLQARSLSSRSKDNNTVSNHASNEVATEFIPLGYLNVEALQDGGQIVRVELPRTALVKFGLPVNMERSNERVKADVLLGLDGMAHAIRFVQDKRLQ
jgi:hypothetical protein